MSKNYYAGIYDNHGNICGLLRYHSDKHSDAEVRAARDQETAPYYWASSSTYLKRVRAKEVPKLCRELFPWIRYDHHYKVGWTFEHVMHSSYVFVSQATTMYVW